MQPKFFQVITNDYNSKLQTHFSVRGKKLNKNKKITKHKKVFVGIYLTEHTHFSFTMSKSQLSNINERNRKQITGDRECKALGVILSHS